LLTLSLPLLYAIFAQIASTIIFEGGMFLALPVAAAAKAALKKLALAAVSKIPATFRCAPGLKNTRV
jgi:predicted PurR-regulated permease PerM